MAKGPAMSREEAVKAIEVGIGMVADLKEKGYNVLATGEMGIGNTTTSSAFCLFCFFCLVCSNGNRKRCWSYKQRFRT